MTVTTKTVSSGYSTGTINENFQALEDYINNNLLNRDGVEAGEPNQLEVDLDANSKSVINALNISSQDVTIGGASVKDLIGSVNDIAINGYEFLADYIPTSGIEVTKYNQILRDSSGEFWRADSFTSLPYITDGTGMPEGGAFVSVGDANLRQELAGDPANEQGALLVRGSVIYVDTIADLQALPTNELVDGQAAEVAGYHDGSRIGGGVLQWDSQSTETENGVTVFGSASTGRWKRPLTGQIRLSQAGAQPTSSGVGAESAYQSAIDVAAALGQSVVNDIDLTVNDTVQVRPGTFLIGIPGSVVRKGWDGPTDNTLSRVFSDSLHGSSGVAVVWMRVVGRHENDISAAITALDSGQRDVAFDFRDGTEYRFHKNYLNGFSYNMVRLDGTSTTDDPSEIWYTENRMKYCANNGFWCKHGIKTLVCTGNISLWMGNLGIGIDDLSTTDTYGPPVERLVVGQNITYKTSQRTLSAAIMVTSALGLSLNGNQVAFCGVPGSTSGNGIAVNSGGNSNTGEQKGEGGSVSGNSVLKTEGAGMLFNGLIGGVVGNNTIVDAAGSAGMVFSDSPVLNVPSKRTSVTGNWIGASDGSPAMSRGIYILDAGQENINIHPDNTFYNCNTEVDDQGTQTPGSMPTGNGNVMRGYRGQRQHSFTLSIANNGGNIEHNIKSGLFGDNPEFYDRILGADASYRDTPTISDAVNFNGGAGIDDGSLNTIVLNTGDYATISHGEGMASVGRNTTGTPVNVRPLVISKDVDGTVKSRLHLQLYNANDGSQFNINTANIPSGDSVEIQFTGLIP